MRATDDQPELGYLHRVEIVKLFIKKWPIILYGYLRLIRL